LDPWLVRPPRGRSRGRDREGEEHGMDSSVEEARWSRAMNTAAHPSDAPKVALACALVRRVALERILVRRRRSAPRSWGAEIGRQVRACSMCVPVIFHSAAAAASVGRMGSDSLGRAWGFGAGPGTRTKKS
jgi:hypothetical protein